MKIRPQMEVPNVKPNSSAGQVDAGTQSHFDAALLQAAQSVWETEPDSSPVATKVQQALSAALEQLNQKTPSQLQALVKQPQGLANLTARLAQAEGLNTAQTNQLNKWLLLALPRLLAYKTNVEVPGSSANANSAAGMQAGPQGGPPAAAVFPAGFFQTLQSQAASAGASGSGAQPTPSQGMASAVTGLSNAAGSLVQPDAGSTTLGAMSGALFNGASAASSTPPEAQTSELVVSESGAIRVFSVAENPGQSPVSQAQGLGAQSASQSAAPSSAANGAGQSGAGGAVSGQSATGSTQNQGQGGALVSNQNGTTDTGFPVFLDMDVQVADSNAPLDIQAGSQVTLKGDGTWVLPEGAATASAPKPQAPAPQQTAAPLPAEQGEQAPQPVTVPGPAALPVAVQLSAANESADASAEQPSQAPAVGDSAFLQELQASVEQALGDTPPSGTTQTQAAQQSLGEASQSGVSQAQASQQMVAQAAALGAQPQAGSAPNGQENTQPASNPGVWTGAGATQPGNTQVSVGAAQTQGGSQQAGAFASALAAVGQNSQQSAFGPAQDAGVLKSVSQQISDALDSAGGANPGRLVIQLSPASLGDVQVDLSMVAGKLTAHLVTSQQDVRDVLARDLSGFKAGLESHGIVVNEVSVAVRSGVGDRQAPSDQASQNWGRGLPKTSATAAAEFTGGLSVYSENAAASQQGFSALA